MKVLIVDDEAILRRSLERVFSSRGHQVWTAENGRQGLATWKEVDPDVVLLDVLMPEMTGVQVLEALDQRRGAKVVLMTAYSGDENQNLMNRFSVDMFIPKPFADIFELADSIERLGKLPKFKAGV